MASNVDAGSLETSMNRRGLQFTHSEYFATIPEDIYTSGAMLAPKPAAIYAHNDDTVIFAQVYKESWNTIELNNYHDIS